MAEVTCDHDGIKEEGTLTSALYGRPEAQWVMNHTQKARM